MIYYRYKEQRTINQYQEEKTMIKVAGVTFENRQETLSQLVGMNRSIITVDLVYTTFNNEFAIKLVENSTGREIGWIPKTELYKFVSCNVHQMTGFVNYYNNIYYVRLSEQLAPSREDYERMCQLCTVYGCGLPAFDVRAYAQVFANTNYHINYR